MKKIISSILIGTMILQTFLILGASVIGEEIDVVPREKFKDIVPGEIIVKFKPEFGENKVTRFLLDHGITNHYRSRYSGFYTLKIPQSKYYEIIEIFSKNPNVEFIEPNYIAHVCMSPNDPYYSYQWHLHDIDDGGIDVEPAWDITTGLDATVAIIDTGISVGTDLADTCVLDGYDFVNNDNDPSDDNGHGTHVAGTVAQSTNNNVGVCGVAFDACLMPVKVLDSYGSGTYSDIVDRIYYAVDNGADIISMSLGGSSSSSALKTALEYAYDNDVTCIAASGNDGQNGVLYPAAYDDYVIAVGATQYDKTRASYSNYGSSLDVVAPGGNTNLDQNGDGYGDGVLQQTFSGNSWGYYFKQGTSMATPHVSGTAALLYSEGVTTPDEIREALESTAVDLGDSGWDMYYGYGLINAYDALQYGGEPPPPSSTYSEDFEDALGEEWSTYSSSSYGRNERSTYSANTGSYSWRMDVTSNRRYNLNELILHVTVSGASYLDLNFYTREYNDERHTLADSFTDHSNGDGIAVSDDGTNWVLLWQYPSSVPSWTSYGTFDINNYISINGDIYIKFQQYDNYIISTDGIVWDDIELTSDGTITLTGEQSNNPPNVPNSPNPSNGETDVDLDADLSWTCSDPDGDVLTYDVYFGDSSPPILVSSGQSGTTYDPGTMNFGTTYYWQIEAEDEHGATTSGPIWSFTTEVNTPPDAPSNPSPVDDATDIGISPTLSVDVSDPDGDSMDVTFYDANDDSVIGTDDGVVSGGTASTTWSGLSYDTTYEWYAVADDGVDSTQSSTWYFTTETPPQSNTYSEDFEDALGEEWSTYSSSNYGRNERSTYSANTGSYSWRMDVTSNRRYNLNELILHVTVSGASYLDLSFYTREYNDERHTLADPFTDHSNGDGVAASEDGTNWVLLWQYPSSVPSWTSYGTYDINDYIPIDGDVYIKFQQYDNYVISTDGIVWDDIELTSDGTITLT